MDGLEPGHQGAQAGRRPLSAVVFGRIRDIDASAPATWQDGRAFLTFDIDWAHDEVLADTIAIVERAGVSATWFVTHDTPLLERLRENPAFELGIHPNFNFLLNGDARNGASAEAVVDGLLRIVPDAVSVRSHSTMVSTPLLALFARKGLRFDCNLFVPHTAGIALRPWANWTGVTMVPYCWEDDVAFLSGDTADTASVARAGGLRVFDFHPIHVFLNTDAAERYDLARASLGDPGALRAHRLADTTVGTHAALTRLLEAATA
ncbi:MAG: hypothetical protein Q8L86_16535 [Vicinamibacterales bacterium]|nr:hypothetical protein [Vicinamibacterales bacterium]